VGLAFQHRGGQRDVGGDHQVAGLDLIDDVAVGHVEAAGTWMARMKRDGGVRSMRLATRVVLIFKAFGGTKDDVLDDRRAGVGVDPDLHEEGGGWGCSVTRAVGACCDARGCGLSCCSAIILCYIA
jgi:hypothetical protein